MTIAQANGRIVTRSMTGEEKKVIFASSLGTASDGGRGRSPSGFCPAPSSIAMTFFNAVAKALLAGSADAVIAADERGHIIFWNPGAERVFGYPADVAIGRSLDIIIPESLRERHWAGYARVMEAGVTRYGDGELLSVPGTKQDGSRISLEFTVTLLRKPDGRVFGIAAVLRDVTARFAELRELRRKASAVASAE